MSQRYQALACIFSSSFLFALSPAAVAAPELTLDGNCPGQIQLEVRGATPTDNIGLVRGAAEGTFLIPGGVCAGTAFGVIAPRLQLILATGPDGNATRTANVPEVLCGRPLQIYDNNDCSTSNVVSIPQMQNPPNITLEPYVNGIQDPVALANAGDGSNRLFVLAQRGQIVIVDANGQRLETPFLDIDARSSCCGERGLLGLAFHPEYANNGLFYVNYTNNAGDTHISQFSVTADANIADPDSEQILLSIDQPFSNHNGGDIKFGPDGFLYIGTGDGGSGGDPLGAGQDLDTLLGKMLRIDVNGPAPYGIPADNPFVGELGMDEIWAYGLRNPWRFSFDRLTGDLFIGDVGQDFVEEVDFQPAISPGGENYGWNRMEGNSCFDPPTNCNDGTLTLPIIDYPHFGAGAFSCAVIGGNRYRGLANPSMDGVYFYSDSCSGIIWGALENSDGEWNTFELIDTNMSPAAFGEDEQGELYITDLSGNQVMRIVEQ